MNESNCCWYHVGDVCNYALAVNLDLSRKDVFSDVNKIADFLLAGSLPRIKKNVGHGRKVTCGYISCDGKDAYLNTCIFKRALFNEEYTSTHVVLRLNILSLLYRRISLDIPSEFKGIILMRAVENSVLVGDFFKKLDNSAKLDLRSFLGLFGEIYIIDVDKNSSLACYIANKGYLQLDGAGWDIPTYILKNVREVDPERGTFKGILSTLNVTMYDTIPSSTGYHVPIEDCIIGSDQVNSFE